MPTTKTKPQTTKAAPKPATKPKGKERPIVFPEIAVKECIGENALTVEEAKEILGWEEVEAPNDATSPELYTLTGKHVVMNWNTRNRFLTVSNLHALTQEHLYRRWRFNGDSIVIGKYKSLLQGQHRLISLILAELERTNERHKDYWADYWQDHVTMETLLVYGVEEDDITFRTLNTGREATAAEVFYRCDYFGDRKPGERKDLSRMLEYALRFAWVRTGWDVDAFTPSGKRVLTNSEALEWVNRHKRLPEACKIIYDLNTGKNGSVQGGVSRYLSPGYASAMLYLMALSRSDPDAYKVAIVEGYAGEMKNTRTALLDWSLWNEATQFWTSLAGAPEHTPEVRALREARRNFPQLTDLDGYVFYEGSGAPMREKVAWVAAAWRSFAEHGKVRARDLGEDNLPYIRDPETDEWSLNVAPSVGGIDLGWTQQSIRVGTKTGPAVSEPEEDTGDGEGNGSESGDPSPDDIDNATEEIRKERWAKEDAKKQDEQAKRAEERVRRLKERQEQRQREKEEAEARHLQEEEAKKAAEAEREAKVKQAKDQAAKIRASRRAKKPLEDEKPEERPSQEIVDQDHPANGEVVTEDHHEEVMEGHQATEGGAAVEIEEEREAITEHGGG